MGLDMKKRNGYELLEIINNEKNLSDEEWFEIRDEVIELLKGDAPEEEKKIFHPFGYLEMISIICDGVEYKQNKNSKNK